VAFEAWGATKEEVFLAAADATLNTMVEEIGTVAPRERRVFSLAADSLDLLLFDLLQELVYHKDAGSFCLVWDLRIEESAGTYASRRWMGKRSTPAGTTPRGRQGWDLHRLAVENRMARRRRSTFRGGAEPQKSSRHPHQRYRPPGITGRPCQR
jgi:SHS2 domain-containing protein